MGSRLTPLASGAVSAIPVVLEKSLPLACAWTGLQCAAPRPWGCPPSYHPRCPPRCLARPDGVPAPGGGAPRAWNPHVPPVHFSIARFVRLMVWVTCCVLGGCGGRFFWSLGRVCGRGQPLRAIHCALPHHLGFGLLTPLLPPSVS